jgi:hypothetical protein
MQLTPAEGVLPAVSLHGCMCEKERNVVTTGACLCLDVPGLLQVEYKELIGGGSEDEVVEVSCCAGCLSCAVLLHCVGGQVDCCCSSRLLAFVSMRYINAALAGAEQKL